MAYFIKKGGINILGRSITWNLEYRSKGRNAYFDARKRQSPYRLHIGPGPNWTKPDNRWVNVDVDPKRGDIVMDFHHFSNFPLEDNTVECIYGSHVFEHMSIWVTDNVLKDCLRILKPGGVIRLVLPDVEKSIREYLSGNENFLLFKRRRDRAKINYHLDYTLFDCLREDFVSRSSQTDLLGVNALAHQNAWDFPTIKNDLARAGFNNITRRSFQESSCDFFAFEGTYKSEASQHDRSMYIEAIKSNR